MFLHNYSIMSIAYLYFYIKLVTEKRCVHTSRRLHRATSVCEATGELKQPISSDIQGHFMFADVDRGVTMEG